MSAFKFKSSALNLDPLVAFRVKTKEVIAACKSDEYLSGNSESTTCGSCNPSDIKFQEICIPATPTQICPDKCNCPENNHRICSSCNSVSLLMKPDSNSCIEAINCPATHVKVQGQCVFKCPDGQLILKDDANALINNSCILEVACNLETHFRKRSDRRMFQVM